MTRRIILLLLAFLLVPSPAARAQTAAKPVLKIGLIQSLTGIGAEDGKTALQAATLAAEDLNMNGTPQVTLLVEDDATDPKKTVTAFRKLMTEHVDLIVGATWSFTTNSIVPLAGQNKVSLLSTTTLPESIDFSPGAGFAYSDAIGLPAQEKAIRAFLTRIVPAKRVAVISVDNTWGEAQRRFYSELLQAAGVEIVDTVKSVSFDVNDWSAIIPRIKAKDADLVLLLLNKGDLDVFIRKAREQRLQTAFYASYHFYDTLKLSSFKDIFEGVCFPYPLERRSVQAEFIKRYQSRFGEEPRIFADSSYDALFLAAKAFETARSRKISLNDALRETDFEGLGGRYHYSPQSTFSTGECSLVCVRNGAPVRQNFQ